MSFIFFNDTATTEIYTLPLHDALPIFQRRPLAGEQRPRVTVHPHHERTGVAPLPLRPTLDRALRVQPPEHRLGGVESRDDPRSEEHTSELQSRQYLVCRLLLEKKKNNT